MPIREDEVSVGAAASRITTDRLCARCQYNLRGLMVGGQCPECGMVIKTGSVSRKHDTIANCTLGYLRQLNLGMLLITIGVLVNTLTPVLIIAGLYGFAVALVWAAAGLALPVGGWLITSDRRSMVVPMAVTKPDGRLLRLITRGSLAVSMVFALLFLAGVLFSAGGFSSGSAQQSTSRIEEVLTTMLALSEQLSIVLLMLVMMWLAEFAHDEDNAGRFRFCAWVFGAGLLFELMSLPSFWVGGLFRFLGLVIWVIELIAFFVFAFATLSLWNATNWAISNWRAHRESEQRARDKFNEQRRHARLAAGPPGFEPLPVDLKHATPPPPASQAAAPQPPDDPGDGDDGVEIYGFARDPDDNR